MKAKKAPRQPIAAASAPEHGSATSEPTVMPVSSTVLAVARSSGGSHAPRYEMETGKSGPCDMPSSTCAHQSARTDVERPEPTVHATPAAVERRITAFGPIASASAPPAICVRR